MSLKFNNSRRGGYKDSATPIRFVATSQCSPLGTPLAYTFEAGHLYEPEARAFMMNVAKGGPFKESYRYRSDSFLSKSDAIPLQAADMLAWEWTKCQDETLEKRIRPIRQSLYALFKSDPRRYTVRHFTGPKLAEYFGIARNLGLLQLQEDEQR
jgi:hypothetical protein